MRTDELEIPHPRMTEREFVLSPMRDLEDARGDERGIVHPATNKTMSRLLRDLEDDARGGGGVDDGAGRVVPLPRGRMLYLNRTLIMGTLNVTPDSFSDGGRYSSSVEIAAEEALRMEQDGADIIDVGGESTRPGAEDVAAEEELARVLPVIRRIRSMSDVPISIDTRNAAVARAAVGAGADVVNNVSGGAHDPDMLGVVADLGVPMVIMHMRGDPRTMTSLANYDDDGGVVECVASELARRSAAAESAGVLRWLQVLDPGIGFAKDVEGNLVLLRGTFELRRSLGMPALLIGPSRKGFIGKVSGEDDPRERDFGTVAACLASFGGVDDADGESCTILRVHNVRAARQAVLVYEAIRNAGR